MAAVKGGDDEVVVVPTLTGCELLVGLESPIGRERFVHVGFDRDDSPRARVLAVALDRSVADTDETSLDAHGHHLHVDVGPSEADEGEYTRGPHLFGGALVSYQCWSATIFFWRARRDSNP